MSRTIDRFAVMGLLNAAVRDAGGEAAFARKHGLTRQEVHEAMKGNRHPAPGMLTAVGIRKAVKVTYEMIERRDPDARLNDVLAGAQEVNGYQEACRGDVLDCPCASAARVTAEEAGHG
jgi:DNA-binding phage protein